METILLFSMIFILLLSNVPVGISIGLSLVIYIVFFFDMVSLSWLTQGMFTSLDSFPLMAVPFFILAGTLMEYGGLSKRLISFAQALVGGVRGGLAYVTIVACLFFGAISGSGPATVAAIGAIMIPSMVKEGYSRGFATALSANAGSLGVIIPPSIPLVVYGVATGASVGHLFIAGIIPGLVVALALIVVSWILLRKNKFTSEAQKFSSSKVARAGLDAIWALFVPVIILGGIYSGIFTPTESAVIAVVYGLITGFFVYKELTISLLIKALIDSSVLTGAILIIAALATPLGRIASMVRIPETIASTITNISENHIVILLMINVVLIIVGMFLDTLSALLILAPILLPIVTLVGVDPVHFGIIMIVNLAIGFVTPPVGMNLLVASGVGNISFEKVFISAIPFIIGLVIALLVITYIPIISLYLPSLFG